MNKFVVLFLIVIAIISLWYVWLSDTFNEFSNDATESIMDMVKIDGSDIENSKNDTLSIEGKFYLQYCRDPIVSVFGEGDWVQIGMQTLPSKGVYVLDGEFVGYGSCDVISCYEKEDLQISLLEYEKVGEVSIRDYDTFLTGADLIPEYKSRKVNGKVRVEIPAFLDSACTQQSNVIHEFDIL